MTDDEMTPQEKRETPNFKKFNRDLSKD